MDNGSEIPEAWMRTVKQHNSRSYHSGRVRKQRLVRTMGIEILQSLTTTARNEMHQSGAKVFIQLGVGAKKVCKYKLRNSTA